MDKERQDGRIVGVGVKAMLATLDIIETELEELRQEWAEREETAPVFDAIEQMLVDAIEQMLVGIRCNLATAIEEEIPP